MNTQKIEFKSIKCRMDARKFEVYNVGPTLRSGPLILREVGCPLPKLSVNINADFDGDEIDKCFPSLPESLRDEIVAFQKRALIEKDMIWTPLMCACYEGDRDQVDELLKEGARVEERDGWGWTPLLHACCTKHNEYIIRTLIAHGASVNIADNWGVTPLMVTFEYGSYNEWELRMGKAELDTVNDEGQTALMYACDAGDTSGMQLCYSGARVDIIDNNGMSALDHALETEEISLELAHTIVNQMGELKTRSKENDRLLLDILSRWVTEWQEEIEMSRTKRRHRWGGHSERFMLRESSYDLARNLIYEDLENESSDRFHGLSPLIYACANGNLNIISNLCSQKGTFFSPDFKSQEDLTEYQEKMKALAVEAGERDRYLEENPEERRKILFGA